MKHRGFPSRLITPLSMWTARNHWRTVTAGGNSEPRDEGRGMNSGASRERVPERARGEEPKHPGRDGVDEHGYR